MLGRPEEHRNDRPKVAALHWSKAWPRVNSGGFYLGLFFGRVVYQLAYEMVQRLMLGARSASG
jgi:hypothetical protein